MTDLSIKFDIRQDVDSKHEKAWYLYIGSNLCGRICWWSPQSIHVTGEEQIQSGYHSDCKVSGKLVDCGVYMHFEQALRAINHKLVNP
jgi:hypothetical protein